MNDNCLTNDLPIEALRKNAGKAAKFLKLLANQKRLMVLCHLAKGEKSVGELEGLVKLSQSALSQHLARLRADKLVKTRRDGQTVFYSIADSRVQAILEALYREFCT